MTTIHHPKTTSHVGHVCLHGSFGYECMIRNNVLRNNSNERVSRRLYVPFINSGKQSTLRTRGAQWNYIHILYTIYIVYSIKYHKYTILYYICNICEQVSFWPQKVLPRSFSHSSVPYSKYLLRRSDWTLLAPGLPVPPSKRRHDWRPMG